MPPPPSGHWKMYLAPPCVSTIYSAQQLQCSIYILMKFFSSNRGAAAAEKGEVAAAAAIVSIRRAPKDLRERWRLASHITIDSWKQVRIQGATALVKRPLHPLLWWYTTCVHSIVRKVHCAAAHCWDSARIQRKLFECRVFVGGTSSGGGFCIRVELKCLRVDWEIYWTSKLVSRF